MRFHLFVLAGFVFLALVILYQGHVLRELSSNLHWLVEHCTVRIGQP